MSTVFQNLTKSSANVNLTVARICSVKKGALKNFAKFTGKHPCHNHILIKLQAEVLDRCFPVNFENVVRTPVFIAHLR